MRNLLPEIEACREAILLGEIGAFLHMFGKASSEFLRANSVEGGANDTHQDQKHFPKLWSRLDRHELQDAFSFTLHSQTEKLRGSFTDFIGKYKGKAQDCMLLQLFNTCHRMTSSDEKGVVRRKQSITDMYIATPFGYRAQKLDPDCVDATRIEMDEKLAHAFDCYLGRCCGIEALRETVVQILQSGLSQALGETRLPANDVNLWAQSSGVASLYKPVLALLAVDMDPCSLKNGEYNYNDVRWRLLGAGWNGPAFVGRGRKPADILRRQDILNTVTRKIRQVIEAEFPLGNLVYRDLSGLFFTFPGIADNDVAEELVREIALKVVPVVHNHSNEELWPFFTLSRPRRTITIIAKEMQVRDGLAALPRVATILSAERENSSREERLLMAGPDLTGHAAGQDICPVCGFRSKREADENCSVCRERRQNRQYAWQSKRQEQTVWIDEVADARNRVALLTLRFDLSRWLSGEWLSTIQSQTFQEWAGGERLFPIPGQVHSKLKDLVSRGEIQLPVCNGYDVLQSALGFAKWVCQHPKATERKLVLESFLEKAGGAVDDVDGLLSDIVSTYNSCNEDTIVNHFFTQNPSPGRLARIWEETEGFFQLWLSRVNSSVFPNKPRRFSFKTCCAVTGVRAGRTYRIIVPDLAPEGVVVLCLDDGGQDFLTVDSLEKFRLERDDDRFQGLPAVQQALSKGGVVSWVDEETGEQLDKTAFPADSVSIDGNRFAVEPYLPCITLASSPVFCQVLLPAGSIPAVLSQLLEIYGERFEKVQGKLPLHVGLLVAKRKYPLYALLEAGQQILDHPSLREGLVLYPWWETTSLVGDPFFSGYPSKPAGSGKHNITDLTVLSGSQAFWMIPGYFDFDFLGSTADRHRLNYEDRVDRWPVRPSVGYGRLRPRPFLLHYMQKMFEVWDDLSRLSRAQRHRLEETLRTKLEEWIQAGEKYMSVFVKYGRAVLHDSYGDKWQELPAERKRRLEDSLEDGLLLETLELFQHVIKEGSLDE